MNSKRRALVLATALAATLAAVYWASGLEEDKGTVDAIAAPSPRHEAQAAARPAAGGAVARGLDLSRLRRGPGPDPSADPFALRDFRPAPPVAKHPMVEPAPAMAPPAPPPPQAPPLPFAYVGRLAEGKSTTVFLAMGDRNLVVRPGDVIDNNYRVEEVTESAVVLTYLPLTVKQTLPIGAK